MPVKEVNWDEFQFRCHYFGELMTKTRGKSNEDKYQEAKKKYDDFVDKLFENDTKGKGPTPAQSIKMNELEKEALKLKEIRNEVSLSDTCKRRLAQIYTEETTGRVKDIESVYLEKGIETEEASITLYSLRTGTMYRKNKEKIGNGFVIGEIDFDDEEKDTVIDTKSSWDAFTFDATVAKNMGGRYWWQLQMYMWLKKRSKARLAYCLNNTPNEIIHRLKKRMEYNFVGTQYELELATQQLWYNHTFDDLPLERKIRIYEIERDESAIAQAQRMIPIFRNYLKNITNTKLEEDETI